MVRRNLIIIVLATAFSWLCHLQATHNRYGRYLADAYEKIYTRALGPVDSRQLYRSALSGMLDVLDEHSGYVPPEDLARFEEDLEQEFAGVGISVRMEPGADDRPNVVVVAPMLGTPAFNSGVQPDDIILKVDGESIAGLPIDAAVRMMRGPVGETVVLTVQHADTGEIEDISITRARIQVSSVLGDTRDSEGNWRFVLAEQPPIGYIRVTNFGTQTADELKSALTQLESRSNVSGLILDLRGNTGGLLRAAVHACDMFLEEGVIVTTRGRAGEIVDGASPGSMLPDVPIAVLIDGASASASEIVAACLQDHQRAVVVGERSYGKGTVQSVVEIEGGRAILRLTTAAYWRPSERNIHRRTGSIEEDDWGVVPDPGFEVKLTDDQRREIILDRQRRDRVVSSPKQPAEPPPVRDPQLDRAVEYLTKLTKIAA